MDNFNLVDDDIFNSSYDVAEPKPIQKRYYLIDYENVHYSGLNGLEKLTEISTVIIFYTQNAESIPIPFFQKFAECKAKIEFYRVECGEKNALDFQLSTFLGYILGEDKNADCHIISNDKGYEFIRSFWKAKNIKIKISSDIAGNIKTETKPVMQSLVSTIKCVAEIAQSNETEFDIAVKPLNLSKGNKNLLYSIFKTGQNQKSMSANTYINNEIGRKFGSDKQKEYYGAIKKLIK
ncbi:MAG: hypothetical protein J6I55_07375 [Ruminococcus sp.]|nr:hypothetical protein [Ruminococcus sp.]